MLVIQCRMHPDIQSFPNTQYYDNALRCGLTDWPTCIDGIPWPRNRCGANRPGSSHTGDMVAESDPRHRVLYVHCSGEETNEGFSPSNEMQVGAVEYLLDCVHYEYKPTPTILVLRHTGDNTRCSLRGYPSTAIAGSLSAPSTRLKGRRLTS